MTTDAQAETAEVKKIEATLEVTKSKVSKCARAVILLFFVLTTGHCGDLILLFVVLTMGF
jgi:hypothetical protein